MKIESANQWISISANVAVLFGIAFLAYELRQNTRIAESQTRASITSEAVDHQMRLAENKELSRLFIKVNNQEELTQVESLRVQNATRAHFRRWENIHYQYRQGLYSESEFSGQRQTWRYSLRLARFRDHWESNRTHFSAEFAKEIDRIISTNLKSE